MVFGPRLHAQEQTVGILPMVRVGMTDAGSRCNQDTLPDSATVIPAPGSRKDTSMRNALKEEEHGYKSMKNVIRALLPERRPPETDLIGTMVYFVVHKTLNHEYRER